MRSLAHVEEIVAIDPIENADAIEVATVLGWKVVVKKNEFKVGDKVIYIEIDSIVPETPYFEFLRNKNFKVKTIKLRGQISQGLIVPITLVPSKYHKVGTDVTNVLKITKRDDSEAPRVIDKKKHCKFVKWLLRFRFFRWLFTLGKKSKKDAFPSWVRKTDETRIQNIPHVLKDKERRYVVTEKVDGCSATYTLKKSGFKYKYVVASRNRVADKDSVYHIISEKYNLEELLKTLFVCLDAHDHVTIQGEIIAPKVQGNKYKVQEPDFYVFNVIIDGERLCTMNAKFVVDKCLKFVPILDSWFELPDTVEEMLAMADGKSQLTDTLREGFVIRSDDGDVSFKVVSNKFLLKNNE